MSEHEIIRNNILQAVQGWQPIVDRHKHEAALQERLNRELDEERYWHDTDVCPCYGQGPCENCGRTE